VIPSILLFLSDDERKQVFETATVSKHCFEENGINYKTFLPKLIKKGYVDKNNIVDQNFEQFDEDFKRRFPHLNEEQFSNIEHFLRNADTVGLIGKKTIDYIEFSISQSKKIVDARFKAEEGYRYAFQNYLNMAVNMSQNKNNTPNPDILLMALSTIIENIRDHPELEGKKLKYATVPVSVLCEWLSLGNLYNDLKDIELQRDEGDCSEAVLGAIQDTYGMPLMQLTRYMRGALTGSINSSIKKIKLEKGYEIEAVLSRDKSIHSIYTKINNVIKKTGREKELQEILRMNPSRRRVALRKLYAEILQDPYDSARSINDLLGYQIIFRVPKTLRKTEKLAEIQSYIRNVIEKELKEIFNEEEKNIHEKHPDLEFSSSDFQRKEKLASIYGYQDYKTVAIWPVLVGKRVVQM
ncbi:hypothetical protein BVX93_00425, partial [bacterium B13(2017)]